MYCYPRPKMTVPRYTCRACKIKVDEDIVENALHFLLKSISVSPESLRGDNDNEVNLRDNKNRLELLKKDLKVINKNIDTLVDLSSDNGIDSETFSSRFDPLIVRRDNISMEIPRLQGEIDFINNEDGGRQYVVSQATTLAALWSELSYEARRRLPRRL